MEVIVLACCEPSSAAADEEEKLDLSLQEEEEVETFLVNPAVFMALHDSSGSCFLIPLLAPNNALCWVGCRLSRPYEDGLHCSEWFSPLFPSTSIGEVGSMFDGFSGVVALVVVGDVCCWTLPEWYKIF